VAAVYHSVPHEMVGDVIYPLNQLAAVAPEVYERQRSKYAGREQVLDFRIPHLGVLWNDVVHCSSLHPFHIFEACRAVGIDDPFRWLSPQFFEIPLERILVHRAVWYAASDLSAPAEHFEPFDAARYEEGHAASPAQLAYLREVKERGESPLLFFHVPHVLVAGPIDTRGLHVIRWNEPP
jgi:hypothetical protein